MLNLQDERKIKQCKGFTQVHTPRRNGLVPLAHMDCRDLSNGFFRELIIFDIVDNQSYSIKTEWSCKTILMEYSYRKRWSGYLHRIHD